VLYLGEINDTQELAWRRSIEVLEEGATQPRTLSLFPEDRCDGLLADASIVRVRLSELRLRRPRQWGACWLVLMLWRELGSSRSALNPRKRFRAGSLSANVGSRYRAGVDFALLRSPCRVVHISGNEFLLDHLGSSNRVTEQPSGELGDRGATGLRRSAAIRNRGRTRAEMDQARCGTSFLHSADQHSHIGALTATIGMQFIEDVRHRAQA
jgi:hypothetical protein